MNDTNDKPHFIYLNTNHGIRYMQLLFPRDLIYMVTGITNCHPIFSFLNKHSRYILFNL